MSLTCSHKFQHGGGGVGTNHRGTAHNLRHNTAAQYVLLNKQRGEGSVRQRRVLSPVLSNAFLENSVQ